MTPRLKSVTISNFRSIRGTVTVPLDSPVVLIHGPNGAGKTSLLAGIELALTGQVDSLARIDPAFGTHLVHKEADEGQVSVVVGGLADQEQRVEIRSKNRRFSGEGLLSKSQSRFYSERCYLAQSTLGRLLEIYQDKDAKVSDSPLTKFVKDLLGLDQLDALVDGLHDAGDVRRLKSATSKYWEVRDGIPRVESEVSRLRRELSVLETELGQLTKDAKAKLAVFDIPEESDLNDPHILLLLQSTSIESQLQSLANIRRDVSAANEQWLSVQSEVTPQERVAVEAAVKKANEVAERWRATTGQQMESVFSKLAGLFLDLPSPSSTRPGHARIVALQIVSAELSRCSSVLARDAEDAKKLASIDEQIAKLRSRSVLVDEQIAKHAVSAGGLVEALTGILPHIRSEDCPVCSRNFSEVSDRPLSAHLSGHISALTESAGRLQALSRERVEGVAALATAERERGVIASRLMATTARDDLKTRLALLTEFQQVLQQMENVADEGEKVLFEASEASGRLNALRAKDQKATSIRMAAQKFAQELELQGILESEPLAEALQRFRSHIVALEEKLKVKESACREVLVGLKQIRVLFDKKLSLTKSIDEGTLNVRQLIRLKELGDERISQAKELARRARQERTNIVRRVFNDSLNSIWRDLFVRLAPDEPFVPAFALPQSEGGAVEAALETVYRAGGKGGNPRAMLSAGNLNTAALTLFLALHLSVKPVLPWMLIDDPVQSMDEVHIAQFAALLRTLSKQHNRQIVVAVHEKPLFDYLALELSPAFQNDRLITVDIGRAADGMTMIDYEPQVWIPDSAITA